MNLNVFRTFICIGIAGLSAFGFFMSNEADAFRILITVGSIVTLFVTLGGLIALSSSNRGQIVNIRVISGIFFLLFFIEHIIFSLIEIRFTPYIIITGILLLLYFLTCYICIRAIK